MELTTTYGIKRTEGRVIFDRPLSDEAAAVLGHAMELAGLEYGALGSASGWEMLYGGGWSLTGIVIGGSLEDVQTGIEVAQHFVEKWDDERGEDDG